MVGLVIITAASSQVYAQNGVGINPTGAAAHPSAALDVSATTQGLLPPRMTAAEKVAIVSPANGLLIFQTDDISGFWYYNATTSAWVQAVGPAGSTGPQGPAGATGSVGSVTAISGTSNANGAIISGGNLTLTPANATNGGIVTNGAQTFAGTKTFNAQLGVGTSSPNTTAALDVTSTTQGFLPPRMTATQRNAIANPATGLVVFCTNCGLNGGELEVFAAGIWRNMAGGTAAGVIAIGQSFGGGIVAYILQPNDPGYDANMAHGLIAATSDQGTAQWGCYGTTIAGADGLAIGTGNQNTIDIMSGCATANIAARKCGDLDLNGYTDWYLPSLDELTKLYFNIGQGAPARNIGGFTNSYYWSSTEVGSANAWNFTFANGGAYGYGDKYDTFYVRAVRAF